MLKAYEKMRKLEKLEPAWRLWRTERKQTKELKKMIKRVTDRTPEQRAKDELEFPELANQFIREDVSRFRMGLISARDPLIIAKSQSDHPATVKGKRELEKSLQSIRSSRIFRAVTDPQMQTVFFRLREFKKADPNWLEFPQEFAAEVLDVLAADPSPRKQKILDLGFTGAEKFLHSALQQITSNRFLEPVNLSPIRLAILFLDPLVLPAQSYLLEDNLRESLTLPQSEESQVYLEGLTKFGRETPALLNYLALVGPQVVVDSETLHRLLALASNVPAQILHPLAIMPFFSARLDQNESHLMLPLVKQAMNGLIFGVDDKGTSEKWREVVAGQIRRLEEDQFGEVAKSLLKLLAAQSSLAGRTKALAYFVLLWSSLAQPAVLKDLLILANRELGGQTHTELVSIVRQIGGLEGVHQTGGVQFLSQDHQPPSLIQDGLRNSPEILPLLDVEFKVSFASPAAAQFKLNLVSDRTNLNLITRQTRGLSIGEYEALHNVKNIVEPAGYVSFTNPTKFMEKVGGTEFENTFQYLSAVRQNHQVILPKHRRDPLSQAMYKGRAIKGMLLTRTLGRQFSTAPSGDNEAEPEPVESVGESEGVESSEPTESVKAERPLTAEFVSPDSNKPGKREGKKRDFAWTTSFKASRSNPEMEQLIVSDVSPQEFRKSFQRILETAEPTRGAKAGIFMSIFKSPRLVLKDPKAEVSEDSDSYRLADSFFDPQREWSPLMVFEGETRLGAMPIDLNQYSVRPELRGVLDSASLKRVIDQYSTRMSHTQYFTLLNLHIRDQNRNPEVARGLVEICLINRWPKALIQTLHLLLQNNILTEEVLDAGLRHLSRFRFMASEGVDICVGYLKASQNSNFDPACLGVVLDAMIDCGQVADAFFRFEDIKNALQVLRYTENPEKTGEENEKESMAFKGRVEVMRQKLYSIMFDLAVNHNVTHQAVLLFAEMMNTKSFKSTLDAMNLLRYSRRAQSDLNTCLAYIKEDMKYAENSELVFPSEYVVEWLEVFRHGSLELARNSGALLNMFFLNRLKTPLNREHLSGVLKMVMVHSNFFVLNSFLEIVARDKKAAKEMGDDAKEGILAVISRCSSEDLRADMIRKVDRIFQLESGLDPNRLTLEQKKALRMAAIERFDSVWQSRLEKFEERVFEPTEKHRPRKRPLKDKRSFLRQTFEPLIEAELEAAKAREQIGEDFDAVPWMKERQEVIREIQEAERVVDAHRKSELGQGLYSEYDQNGRSDAFDEELPKEKKKKLVIPPSAFKSKATK